MLGVRREDVRNLVLVNYFLIVVEAPVAFYFSYRFPEFTYLASISIVGAIFLSTLAVHIALLTRASDYLRDTVILLFAFVEVGALTLVMHYVPTLRSAMILMFIPSVIFSSSMSLSFGVVNFITIIIMFSALTLGEFYHLADFFSKIVDVKTLSPFWHISNVFSFFFLTILAFMSNYFFEILRIRERKIHHLADLNKKLYQKSKATSDEIFKKMREALVVIDKKHRIVQYNNAFKQIVNGQDNLINKNITNLPIEFADDIKKYIKEIEINQSESIQFKTVDRAKHNYTVHISLIKLAQDETGYIMLINKHALPWGTVFDSVTKNPIDLVLVRLINGENKRVIETKVTDREGRFGFIVPAGKYYIFVSKEGFKFPSDKTKQGYRGEQIEIKTDSEGVIKINIPIDQIKAG